MNRPDLVCRPAATGRVLMLLLAGAAAVGLQERLLQAQSFTDPGFESYSVADGAFLRPASGEWIFVNDAGVVDPPSPSSSTGPLNTWSATFPAIQGEQYASTYAGLDSLSQSVFLAAPGAYLLSVYAAAPDGSITIPPLSPQTLVDGEFTFILNNSPIGNSHSVTAGATWTLYSVEFSIDTPGSYLLGLRNTRADAYFINYDAFEITPVPEPAAWQLTLLLGGMMLSLIARAGRPKTCRTLTSH